MDLTKEIEKNQLNLIMQLLINYAKFINYA